MSSWATKTCPDCGDEIAEKAKVHKCGWRMATVTKIHQPIGMSPSAKAAYESAGKTSADLTPQQWYNVCRFFPNVARRCKRKFLDVGPHNPLHSTSKLGAMFATTQGKYRPYIDFEEAEEV